MFVRRPIAAAALAALATGLVTIGGVGPGTSSAAAATSAGTLVYIKGNNIWLSRGDGTGARALTTDGTATRPYASPSQSDGGIIAAARLDEIVRMDQSGFVLNRMNPTPLPSSVNDHPIDGNLQDVALSPDGSTIAYSVTQWLSPPGASAGYRTTTGYTPAAAFADPAPRGMTVIELGEPSWIGNGRTLLSGGFGSHVMIDDLGPAKPAHWFDDTISPDLGNSELSPNGRHVVAVAGNVDHPDESSVVWYRVDGNAVSGPPPAQPTEVCFIGPTDITDPTWAPDSDSLAWVEADGIWVRSGVEDCLNMSEKLLIPGGSQPDWSPAALAPPVHDGPPNDPTVAKFVMKAKPKLTGVPKLGRKLKATTGRFTPNPAAVRFQWLRDNKSIKGATKATYKLGKKDLRHRLRVKVTVSKAGVATRTVVSAPVRVKR